MRHPAGAQFLPANMQSGRLANACRSDISALKRLDRARRIAERKRPRRYETLVKIKARPVDKEIAREAQRRHIAERRSSSMYESAFAAVALFLARKSGAARSV